MKQDVMPVKNPETPNTVAELEPDLGAAEVAGVGLSEQGRQALEVAEAARQQSWDQPSFVSELFLGNFRPQMMMPFPVQSAKDKAIGDHFIEQLKPLLRKKLNPDEVDRTRTIPQDLIDAMKELGVFAMKVPKEYGGLGMSQVNYNRVMMLIASYCGSTAVLVSAHQSIGVPQPLKMFGTTEQKAKYLPRFRAGAISAFALTEPDVGSDPAQMKTIAEPTDDGDHFIINGEKLWCTNGPIADVLVVMARTPDKMVKGKNRQQITAFIVEGDTPGLNVEHRCDFMGIRGIQNGLLSFKDVRVPKENIILGEGKGLKLALTTLNTGRLTLPAACAGVGKQCVYIARTWAKVREQWGKNIGRHEACSQYIADITASTFAMEACTWLTSHWADQGDQDIRLEAAMAKLFCSETAWRVVDTTLQLRGGRGYERASSLKARGELPFPCERMLRDMRINRIIEGTTEIMHLFLAREAMDPHLSRALPLMKPGVSLVDRLKTLVGCGLHYGRWYPRQWVPQVPLVGFRRYGALGKHLRYVQRTSRRLSRSLFHAMARHGPKLETQQALLRRLMEIGTELFAMSATVSYSWHLLRSDTPHRGAVQAADTFCRQARMRIDQHWHEMRHNATKANNELTKRVLHDDCTWIEDGILRV